MTRIRRTLLIARVRNGDLEAYGELFGRHHLAAERMARQLVPANDADDLASDAFAKVLDALRSGGGPDISFRAYLLTTVRRVHVDRIRSGRKVQATDDIAAYEREPETFDDPTVSGFERRGGQGVREPARALAGGALAHRGRG